MGLLGVYGGLHGSLGASWGSLGVSWAPLAGYIPVTYQLHTSYKPVTNPVTNRFLLVFAHVRVRVKELEISKY